MKIRITGTGATVPPLAVGNDRLLRLFPGPRKNPWTAADFEQRTGIRERRFCVDLDDDTGRAILPPGFHNPPGPAGLLGEQALREALEMADIDAAMLDGLIVGSCTPDLLHFGSDAQLLHHRLGMRPDATVLQTDVGCGGAIFCLQWAKEMILSGVRKRVAVVMTHVVSPILDRDVYSDDFVVDGKVNEAFLSALLFGDGAGAVILEATGDNSRSGMISSVTTNEHYDIVTRRAGGNLRAPGRPDTVASDYAFHILGGRVAEAYAPRMKRSIEDALALAGMGVEDIGRFFPHQSNRRLIEKLIDVAGLPEKRTAVNVERYGNTSGASVLILLAEDVRNGEATLGSGEPVVLAAIGANLQNGAHVICL